MLSGGWEFATKSVTNEKYIYQWKPYLEPNLDIKSHFVIKNLLTNDFIIEILRFKFSMVYSILFSTKG